VNSLVLVARLWRSFLAASEYGVKIRYCEPWAHKR
jgi:hypothetical protein